MIRKSFLTKTILMTFVLIFTLVNIVQASPSDWAEEFVESMMLEELSSQELLESSKFQEPITREEFAELAVILYAKAKGVSVDEIVQWNPFNDTDNKMVAKAYNIGIVTGTGTDKLDRALFSPTNKVTRQEIAVMLVKLLKVLDIDVEVNVDLNYSDENIIAVWAYDSVAFASESGILSGVGDNKLAPTSNATREQALVLVNKIGVKYSWIKNNAMKSLFTSSNSTSHLGFKVPNYDSIELRAIKYTDSIKYVISNLVDSPSPDIEKQQTDLVNIIITANPVSYDALVEIREIILASYDPISKKFKKQNTVYIGTNTGVVSSSKLPVPYISINVDTELTLIYVNK